MPGVRWTMKSPGGSAPVRFASGLFVRVLEPGGTRTELTAIVQGVSSQLGPITRSCGSGHRGRNHRLERLRPDQHVQERDGRDGPGDQEGPAVPEEEDESRVDLEVGL